MDELTQKFQMFEVQIRQIQEQLEAIQVALQDMKIISEDLEEMKGKVGKEILAPIGKGIFAKAKLLSEELIVNVGNGNLVEKTIDETKEIISNQEKRLKDSRENLEKELERINEKITETMKEYEKEVKKE